MLVFMLATPGYCGSDIARANAQAYCNHKGYEFVFKDTLIDSSVAGHWNKLLWLDRLLPTNEAVFVLDADAIFANFSISLTDYLTDDITGSSTNRGNNNINSGAIMWKRSEKTISFMKQMLVHKDFGKFLDGSRDECLINDLLGKPGSPTVTRYARNKFASFYFKQSGVTVTDMTEETVVCHWMGYLKKRPEFPEVMKELSDIAFKSR